MAIQSTPTPAVGAIPRTREQALIGAHNAAGLAQSYLEKGSYHAAKRKIIAALRDLELLTSDNNLQHQNGGAA